ncbi:hypothetical protein [Acinetobacter haemolyticus]|uniref:Uncharacterized protein n=1 Tax=Acinetobacter haemolyticus TaxID=29430 RepID=A0A3S9ARC9_ACIHA|nr:hypothetical protein [Acinetobacter haemolyticus]AZN67117.1 hypothetical protein DX910_01100 [Acinetobacter haemolyticus]ENW19347.1 hypothetical protein F926_02914 [Acinetobacter haemolyticus NIPH 261]MBO3657863.1 hypothetical protein [Acinetobacter haemolyticus]NAR53632.1 hypothetical protein [Acinetobacter haemolyticus]NAR59592.1 hypothetical protein [Acinetobacter haemolyticus]
MRQFKSLYFAILAVSGLYITSAHAAPTTLQSLSDNEMSATTGQALMSLSFVSPTDLANKEAQRVGGDTSVGFYKLGLEAQMELNVNIKKLQLGCGGVNGAGGCDIDIDYLSLSGLGNSETSNTDSAADRAARAGSSAVLTNPFIEFAIRNPDKASTREIVGINLSSEKAIGLITFGLENGPNKSGINSLSGYMEIAATTGIANVNGFGTSLVAGEAAKGTLNQSDGYDAITGRACCVLGFPIGFTTTSYALNLRDKATGSNILKGDLYLPQQEITGKRINVANLVATATVRDIDLSGKLSARAAGIINLDNKDTTGLIRNLMVDVAISEDLGFFHKANLNGTAASLSLQSKDIQWTNNNSVSQNGWWLEFSDPIDIGFIEPALAVDIPKATLNEAFRQVSEFLYANPVQCGGVIAENCLLGSAIPVGTVNLINAARPQMALVDLELATQKFTPNCYGTLKFC